MSIYSAEGPTLVDADPRIDPLWQTLATTPSGSLFTSPPWIRAVCETYGFTPRARIATDAAGRPTDGFAWVPISDIRGDRLVSLPFSDRADPFVTNPEHWPYLLEDVATSTAPLTIRCMEGGVPNTDSRLARTEEAVWQGTWLGRPLIDLYRSISSTARRNIASANRNGVSVEAATGLDAVRSYHRLHVATRKKKYRMLAQPFSLFERIWHEFSALDGVVTILAHLDGNPIAGAVYLVWNDVLYYKFGASLADTLRLRPNDAVAWDALSWASDRGLRLLDWGLSDADQPGLVAFKRKWASEERRIVTLHSSTDDRDQAGGIGPLLGELTALLTDDSVPDCITERAGALLYRYFG